MSINTDWDIEFYKRDYESEEHWELRKKFMEMHKDKFPEDELVCLAQVFTNVEFLGCKYPSETMELVGNLSQDVAKEFRQTRSNRLKRTFVKASDAAEAKAKRGRNVGTSPLPECSTKYNSNRKNLVDLVSTTQTKKQRIVDSELFDNLYFGKFILLLVGDRNCIKISGDKSGGVVVLESDAVQSDNKRKFDIVVNGKLAGSGCGSGIKEAKVLAFEEAMKKLQDECFTIKLRPNPDRIDIVKDNKIIKCSVKKTEDEDEKIDSNNVGYKMMKKLGWSGGGLGLKSEGRENPVDYLIKNNRRGLGEDYDEIDKKYLSKMLNNYINSSDIRDLYFESGFTKEERATLHQIASAKNLKSSSHGKEPNRYLKISKKDITLQQIVEEVLLKKNSLYINKYEVKVPKKMMSQFPDHKQFESESQESSL